jgi:hypothetical protein
MTGPVHEHEEDERNLATVGHFYSRKNLLFRS